MEDFYDNKAHVYEPDEVLDKDILDGIKAKQALQIPSTKSQNKALDPNDLTPGIRKNNKKKWSDFKALTNTEIVE